MNVEALRQSWCKVRSIAVSAQAEPLPLLLTVCLRSQYLDYYRHGVLAARYPVSTAANGSGCQLDSGCTPVGWHVIEQKIGAGAAPGTVFKGRVPVSVASSLQDTSNADLITSRILWLGGLESGINRDGTVDSFSRYIYIHGTAQEHLIGQAVSHGCVRMRNRDVIELFDKVDEQTPVYISGTD